MESTIRDETRLLESKRAWELGAAKPEGYPRLAEAKRRR
jgi:hypothetical protein